MATDESMRAGPDADQPEGAGPRPGVITVVIVDDHLLVAESIEAALGAAADIKVLEIAGTCAAGVAAVARHQPAVLLLDQRLPDGLGTSVLPKMLTVSPHTKVLMLTAVDSDEVLTNAFEAGAVGVITKAKRAAALVNAVKAAANDEPVVTPDVLRRLMPRSGQRPRRVGDGLTSREREVLRLLGAGKSTEEMARALFVAPATVRNHIQSIMNKLGAHSRLEAVAIANERTDGGDDRL